MGHPRRGEKFYLFTDASAYVIGGVLTRKQLETGKFIFLPIAHFSKGLGKHELNNSVTEKEILGVLSMEHFRPF